MNEQKAANWSDAVTLDVRGLRCPLPVLRARKVLLGLEGGQRLVVYATDPMAAIDFPNFCRETGYRLEGTATEGTTLRFLIEKPRRF
jgi:tRNA 2-thiouridine synthesizing protein A